MSVYALTFAWRLPYLQGPDGRPYPLLRVGMTVPGLPLTIVTALVDSGAAVSVFDGRLALRMGLSAAALRAPDREVVPLRGFAGAPSRAYRHVVRLFVGDAREHTILDTTVAFSDPDEPPLSFNLLGRRGFLDQVLFALDERGAHAGSREPGMYLRVL